MEKADFLGSWALRRCYFERDGAEIDPHALGEGLYGFIHYMPDGRMAALIQYGGGPRLSAVPREASDAELAAVARKYYAYGGNFSIQGDRVIHHVDVCSNPNDVGTDYLRTADFRGDCLILGTPPQDQDGAIIAMKLEWQAYPVGRLPG